MRSWLLLFCASCATLADGEPGLDNPPSARAGPFRLLGVGELGQGRVAPYAMDDQDNQLRDVSVLDPDGDPGTLEVEGYFAASEAGSEPGMRPTSIVRVIALDGRSFDREVELVLELDPNLGWQGDRIGAPSVLMAAGDDDAEVEEGSSRRIYFEAEGGLGVATDIDGTFASLQEPVLSQGDVPWATSTLKSPGVIQLRDGSYRLYFEAEEDGVSVIGVAASADGEQFVERGVVLRPSLTDVSVDGAFVGSPCPVLGTSSEGRDILFVYYTARSRAGKQSISMAARFVDEPGEQLEKSGAAMYGPSGGVAPREPHVLRFDAFSLLFTTQKPTKDSTEVLVSVGVSPGNIELPEAK